MQNHLRLLMDAAEREALPAPTLAAATQQRSLARRAAADSDYAALIGIMENIAANDA